MTLPKLRAPRCCPRQRKDRSGLALPEVSAGSALAGLRGMNNERLEVVLPHGRRDHPVQVPPVARWERSFLTKVKLLRVTGTYRSEEHTSELQSLMRSSYAVFCLTKKQKRQDNKTNTT